MLAYLKPKTLFGRMLAIILIPLILVQGHHGSGILWAALG
jgi:hypothetical protein